MMHSFSINLLHIFSHFTPITIRSEYYFHYFGSLDTWQEKHLSVLLAAGTFTPRWSLLKNAALDATRRGQMLQRHHRVTQSPSNRKHLPPWGPISVLSLVAVNGIFQEAAEQRASHPEELELSARPPVSAGNERGTLTLTGRAGAPLSRCEDA